MSAFWWGPSGFSLEVLWPLFLHFAALSLLAVGGAITTVGDMHRYLVREQGWLSTADFNASIALAQAAPGPNVLFVLVLGFQVAGVVGGVAALVGSMLPSTLLAVAAGRYGQTHKDTRAVQAFHGGLAPITVGLLLATGWVLLAPVVQASWRSALGAAALVAITLAWMLRTRRSPMWPVALGAVAGALGWV